MEILKATSVIILAVAALAVVWLGIPLVAGWIVYFYGAPKYFAITVGIGVLMALYIGRRIKDAS